MQQDMLILIYRDIYDLTIIFHLKVNQNKVKKEFANKLVVYEKSGHHGKDIQDFFENILL